ncbi:hypothetical protein NP493_113g04018 [Ridgeia piscesae]|uniref:Uncharacterized protein n=1 Tax=Ridgeia piscesae TaxID=27915 RepID=A0AAD9P6T1_RIDPI|nr:hypothetical protein NP493_113g04018 [Ridgeia piscesae]
MKWLRLPAPRPGSLKHSFARQDMSPGWKTITYQRLYYNIYGELSTGHRIACQVFAIRGFCDVYNS